MEECIQQICAGIELRYDWIRFLEVGADGDHVHWLVQSTPEYSPTRIITTIKSITAKRIFAEQPEVKKMLWGGSFWSGGLFAYPKNVQDDLTSEQRRLLRRMAEAIMEE